MSEWERKASEFFLQYIEAEEQFFNYDGVLTLCVMQETARLLLEAKIYLSKQDIRKQALKDSCIILPDVIFEKVEANNDK